MYGTSYGFNELIFFRGTMDLVGILGPRGAVLLEGGPGVACSVIFTAGAVAAVSEDVTVCPSSLIVVVVIDLGNL